MPHQLKLLELFGGIGACSKALHNLDIDYVTADYVEIDKFAAASYNAVFGTNFAPQDIRKWDKCMDVDLIMHGSPCQSFSSAGRNEGGDMGSGTRSSLLWESVRIIEKIRPKYVIWENVKNLLSKKHRHNFETYLSCLENFGYINYYKILNAKNYGIPQNRERVFTISIRKDLPQKFSFPEPVPLNKFLCDMLEKNVEENFYLTEKQIQGFKAQKYRMGCLEYLLQTGDIARTLMANDAKNHKLVLSGNICQNTHIITEFIQKFTPSRQQKNSLKL